MSETVDGLIARAMAHSQRGELAECAAAIERIETLFPDRLAHACHMVGFADGRLGRVDRAMHFLERSWSLDRTDAMVAYELASCLACTGDFDRANSLLETSCEIGCGDHKTTTSDIIRFPPPERLKSSESPPLSLPFSRHVTADFAMAGQTFDAAYFVCCDTRYFELFAQPLANSIGRNSGLRCLLHIHVVNLDARTRDLIQAFKARRDLAVSISYEHTDLSRLTEDQRRTYYSCARFFMLPKLQEKYSAPIIVADIDQLVVKDLSVLLQRAREHDVTLIHFPTQAVNLLSLVSASMIVVNSTPNGILFGIAVERYLAERMANLANLSWHLDQAALAVTFLMMSFARYHLVDGEIIGVGLDSKAVDSSKALFWTITYSNPNNAGNLATRQFQAYA